MFDMQQAHPDDEGQDTRGAHYDSSKGEDWVTTAVASLASKLED